MNATLPWWLLPALSATTALLSVTAIVLIVLTARRKRIAESDGGRRLNEIATNLAVSTNFVDEKLKSAATKLSQKLDEVKLLSVDDLAPIAFELDKLRLQIAEMPAGGDPVGLEHRVLREQWKQFRGNAAISAAYDTAAQDSSWPQLLGELAKVIPVELKPTFDAVVAPCHEHRTFVQKIGMIPRLIDGEVPRKKTDGEEAWRAREFAMLLTIAQTPSEASNPLHFRFRKWVTETFLPFADLYLQRYQQAALEQRGDEWIGGVQIVRQLLELGGVAPIEVTPGQTTFDSTRHIGRSTSSDPRFSDGVITGVVRNGFIEGGQQVIRQPEVVVNRIR